MTLQEARHRDRCKRAIQQTRTNTCRHAARRTTPATIAGRIISIKPRPEKSSRGFFMSFSEGMITSIFVKNVWR